MKLTSTIPIGLSVLMLGLALAELAQAGWYPLPNPNTPPKQITAGTDPDALNGRFKFKQDKTTATTNFRARCNPCPICDYNPYVAAEITAVAKDSGGVVITTATQTSAECLCPLSVTPVDIENAGGATQLVVSAKVKCGCCGEMGLPEDAVDLTDIDPITLPTLTL